MNTKWTPGSASAADGVDPPDRGAGERAADEVRVQHPRQRDVVDVRAAAGQQPGVLDASDARADVPGCARGSRLRHDRAPPTRARPPGAPLRRCPGSRCSGRGCRTAPRGSRRRSGSGCRAGTRSPTRRTRECRSRTAARGSRGTPPAPWRGRRPGEPMPSIVVTSVPSACTANTRHERTAAPSISTVHAPHTPCSQPRCVPVRWHCSRRKSARVTRGSTVASCARPLTVSRTGTSCMARLRGGRGPRARHHGRAHSLAVRRGAVQVGGDRRQAGHRPGDRPPPARRPSIGRPVSSASAASARSGVDPRPIRPMAHRRIRSSPSSSMPTVAPAIAKSPWRRANSSTAKPVRPIQIGNRTPTRSSSGSMLVLQRPSKKSRAAMVRRTRRRDDLHARVERQRDGRVLRRGVGVRDRSAERAAVADLEVADERRRLREQRHRGRDLGADLDGRLGGPGADPERTVPTLDALAARRCVRCRRGARRRRAGAPASG